MKLIFNRFEMTRSEQLKDLRCRLDAISLEAAALRKSQVSENIGLFCDGIVRANYWLACEIAQDKATAAAAISAILPHPPLGS